MENLRDFLLAELGVELSADREEPRLEAVLQTNKGFLICHEDFFIKVPGIEEGDIWKKIKQFYSPISGAIFDGTERSLVAINDLEKSLIISGSYYDEDEFRVTVNVW